MAKWHNMANDYGWGEDDDDMGSAMPMDMYGRPRYSGDFRNRRYSEAYGSYSGGYGPPPRPLLGLEPYRRFPSQPPFPMGRGIGPMGPRGPPPPKKIAHVDQAMKYLLRCGVPKETVKNLPADLLLLIEPHYCGLCGYGFDAFLSSRLHYVSKNHLRAQTRWQSKQTDQHEAPLKARELYCELCDVHLTSKVHAESHYSGKPHRSIVEGSKKPKNPLLLQKSSEARLEQLIRREKKHLKAIKESKPSESTSKEAKPVQSDLYCDICKTFVTCAEQMTMHLNGKRHLTKEKQHILKVMKGEITESPDHDQPSNGQEPNETEQNTSDWGDGSGNWEEN
ncbi:hypothetical protein ABMA27_011794 [Loxostege sticticalis]|uniref:U1-type domain-containing protein n=1 Tax=Loxostege sticticalis TaxID=481309 RepID=A0ABR3IHJ6_LOXSC